MLTPCLAMIGFVAPWMAWGAVAAVGLPVLAHLLSKTRYREVAFPAARLVQQAVAATSRIETPRHRLLMLLRFLLLLLLVLAFMRPQWTPDAQAIDEERGIALVLLMDASASMQRTTNGATLYGRAARQAQRLIDQLDPARDVAAVITVDHAPASLLPEPTAQLSLLTDRLSSTQPGYTHANWPAAIALALRLTHDSPRAVRLVTLSDQQGGQPEGAHDHVRIEGPADNTAIRLVDVRPYPAIAGSPITATIEVRHFGAQPLATGITAKLGDNQVTQPLALTPGATQRIALRLPPISKSTLLQVTLDHTDAITVDNVTGAWLPVQSKTRALIVHDADEASVSIAKRLATLLNPGEVAGVTLPVVDAVALADATAVLASADPASLRTVLLLSRDPLPGKFSQTLEAYAHAGGGVVQFVTDPAANSSRTTTATSIDFDLEPLRLFEGPARAGLVSLSWPGVGNTPINERATPILMDELERVIVAELPRGRGRLIAINAALSPEPGGLLAQPAFVVLFSELCRYASPGPALPAPAKPGDQIPKRLFDAEHLLIAEGADSSVSIFTAPGPYRATDGSGRVTELVFAELDTDESDTRIPTVWRKAAAGINNSTALSSDRTDNAAMVRHNPIELWPYLVIGVLGLVAVESLLLRRFAGPRPTPVQGGAA